MEFKKQINWNWVISLIAAFILGLSISVSQAITLLMVPQGGTGAGTFTAGNILQGNGTGAIQGSALSGDATLAVGGALTISADAIEESMLKAVDAPADEECLTYEATVGDFEWQSCGAGGGDFSNGGDAGGADRTLGNTDNYDLGFLTNNLNRLHIENDGDIGIGTTTPAYQLDVVGSIQTDTAFRGDYWISATDNSMNIQPTGDVDDFFSFKTPADRPTIKREGGKYIYIESSNVNDVGLSFRKDADHSGTLNYYKDENLFGLTSKDPLVFKACEDYDDYVKICAATNVPEMSTVGAADFKINAGGANSLLLNHAGGNVAVGATSTGYILGLGTGDTFGIGTTQWNSADEIDGTKIKDADYGDVVIDAAGNWQVSEATALASNGANCGAGNYPLGVDASGAVESCTDATTEINTVVNALGGTGLTCAAQSCDVDLGTSIDISDETNLVGGTGITLTDDTLNVDGEPHEKCLYFEDPVATDDFKSLFHFRSAATITGMWCESDQTVNMDLQLDDGTPADINGTDLICDSTPADDTTLGGDTGAGAGERLDLAITSVSGTPTWVSICFDFTYDN